MKMSGAPSCTRPCFSAVIHMSWRSWALHVLAHLTDIDVREFRSHSLDLRVEEQQKISKPHCSRTSCRKYCRLVPITIARKNYPATKSPVATGPPPQNPISGRLRRRSSSTSRAGLPLHLEPRRSSGSSSCFKAGPMTQSCAGEFCKVV